MNAYERKLLVGARQRIESGYEQFICCAIEADNTSRSEGTELAKYEALLELKRRVQLAIDGRYTFECYIYAKYGYRSERNEGRADWWDNLYTSAKEIVYFPATEFANFALQARLAWIDRMLDNNEVK